jgi:xanthine/uracil permease
MCYISTNVPAALLIVNKKLLINNNLLCFGLITFLHSMALALNWTLFSYQGKNSIRCGDVIEVGGAEGEKNEVFNYQFCTGQDLTCGRILLILH